MAKYEVEVASGPSKFSMEGELKKLMQAEAEKNSKPRIQKVPFMLRTKENLHKYFEPRLFPIGPIHHDKFEPAAYTIKRNLAREFISRSSQGTDVLWRKILFSIAEIKMCFVPEVINHYKDEELAWMLFVDGCAVLNCIRYLLEEELDDSIIKVQHLVFAEQDLLLLENQIPFLVLSLLMGEGEERKEWNERIESFVNGNIAVKPNRDLKLDDNMQPAHLLELLRKRLLYKKPKIEIQPKNSESTMAKLWEKCRKMKSAMDYLVEKMKGKRTFRNVKELKEAGIYFKRSTTSQLTDISFTSRWILGVLKLPPIMVDDSTSPKFMNLIAYEMCPDFSNDFGITSYICFLDSLIDEAEDAKELRKARIIENYLGSDEEVSKVFNEISTDLVSEQKAYGKVNEMIQTHCNMKWRTWLAQAYHEHFSSPWTFIAFAAAATAIVLSGIQTKYTIEPTPGPCDDFCKHL